MPKTCQKDRKSVVLTSPSHNTVSTALICNLRVSLNTGYFTSRFWTWVGGQSTDHILQIKAAKELRIFLGVPHNVLIIPLKYQSSRRSGCGLMIFFIRAINVEGHIEYGNSYGGFCILTSLSWML